MRTFITREVELGVRYMPVGSKAHTGALTHSGQTELHEADLAVIGAIVGHGLLLTAIAEHNVRIVRWGSRERKLDQSAGSRGPRGNDGHVDLVLAAEAGAGRDLPLALHRSSLRHALAHDHWC